MEDKDKGVSRRHFIGTAALTGAGLTIVPRHVLGKGFTPPSDLLNIAAVGIGGMGRNNMRAVGSQNIVALCDVDWDFAGRSVDRFTADLQQRKNPQAGGRGGQAVAPAQANPDPVRRGEPVEVLERLVEQLPKAKRYSDFREMLDKQKDIDAVVVATPDHAHAVIAAAAMRLKKHVYVQKPLTYSVHEARALARLAKESGVATQMGNQGHSREGTRRIREIVQSGILGTIGEVHVWTDRPVRYWAQGIPRPGYAAPTPPPQPNAPPPPRRSRPRRRAVVERAHGGARGARGDGDEPADAPRGAALGPLVRPGAGHSVSPRLPPVQLARLGRLRRERDRRHGRAPDRPAVLGARPRDPTSIETISTPFNDASFPSSTSTFFEFAARGNKPAVKMTWYDGGMMPPRPAEFSDEMVEDPRTKRMVYKEQYAGEGGVMYFGTKGKLLHDTYGYKPRLLPQSLHDSHGTPKQTIKRIQTTHEMNWVEAAKGTTEASSPFSYAARLVEVMLLGVVSLRARTKIYDDGDKMRVTNANHANDLLRREYRTGFKTTL